MDYVYLHGFASGPQSYKGQWLRSHFQSHHLTLQLPDLNQGDFAHLTLTRQIQQILLDLQGPTTLIGSSLGGLTAAWVAQQSTQVHRLILLAPAFQFLDQWLPRLGSEQLCDWQNTGWLSTYHYGLQCQQRLSYDFLVDARGYDEGQLTQAVPTLILHGDRDDVISLEASQTYGASRPWVTVQPLHTDHGMADAMVDIWQAIEAVCRL